MGRVTLKVTIKGDANQNNEYVVKIRVTKDRKPRYWPLSMTIPASSFNKKGTLKLKNWVKSTHPEYEEYNKRIKEAYGKADKVITNFEKDGQPPFTATDVVTVLKGGGKPDLFLDYFSQHLVTRKKLAGNSLQKLRTHGQYRQAYDQLVEFLTETKRLKLTIQGLTKPVIVEYQAWLSQRYAPNTIALKLTCLRKVVNEAMEEGLIPYDKYPFRRVTITLRRKAVDRLREDDIDRLMELPRAEAMKPNHVVTDRLHARPCALLMYYIQGIRLGDFVQIKRKNYLRDGDEHRIVYTTGKSSKELNVLLPPEAVELLTPYLVREDGTPKGDNEFLFPYLISTYDKLSVEDKLKYAARATTRLSHQIKALGASIGLGKKVTPHIMRHSFADLLRRNKVDLLTMQMIFAHSDPRTTRDYMDSMDQDAVDSVVGFYSRKTAGKQIDKEDLPVAKHDQ